MLLNPSFLHLQVELGKTICPCIWKSTHRDALLKKDPFPAKEIVIKIRANLGDTERERKCEITTVRQYTNNCVHLKALVPLTIQWVRVQPPFLFHCVRRQDRRWELNLQNKEWEEGVVLIFCHFLPLPNSVSIYNILISLKMSLFCVQQS